MKLLAENKSHNVSGTRNGINIAVCKHVTESSQHTFLHFIAHCSLTLTTLSYVTLELDSPAATDNDQWPKYRPTD
jgi:hypothetical protein